MEKHDVMIQRGDPSQHHSQGIVERFNRTLVDRLFTYQYHKELEDPSKSNREWVSRLQNVVSVLNNEKTRLIGMKPVNAIKQTLVEQGFSQPTSKEYEEKLLDVGTKVRYLYEPGELEGYQYKGERRKRSTDPIWSVDVIKSKIDTFKSINQHCTTLMVDLTIFRFRRATAHSGSLVISSHTCSSSFCFEWVFSCGMHSAHSTFSNIINSFFKTKE